MATGTPRGRRDHVVEQLDQAGRGGERLGLARAHHGVGDLAGEPLLAVLPQDAGQVGGGVRVEDVGGGGTAGAVHAHVEGCVLAVGEAALHHVELEGGDTEVEEHRVDGREAEVVEDVGDLVVDGVHAGEAGPVLGQPLAGEREGLGVAVDADDPGERAALEDRLGVAAEAERRVDEHGTLVVQRRGQEGDDPVQEDRDV